MEFLTKKFANLTIFEWIPYDKFIEIEKIEESDFATAIWKDGPLSYDKHVEEWIRTSYEEVILRILYDSENITNKFINKVKPYLLSPYSDYGISQNPDTRNYILVFRNEYFDYYCQKCGNEINDKWCKSCHINRLKNNFTNWASGNEIIDNFIQMKQLNVKKRSDLIFEWIPYNELIEIKEIGKSGFSVAIWKEGPLHYDVVEKKWMKESEKVILKYLSSSQNITDEFLNEATASIDSYGISQNPNTRDYILVVHNKYYKRYCEKCDKAYINHKCCESCLINYLKNNFINWTSGNEKIDDFIQKKQLKISIVSYIIFEWIPYNEFIEIKEIEDNCLTTAIWEKGPLIYDTLKKEWVKTSYKKVCLRYLYNSQNVTNEFINEVGSYLTDEKYYGVSQNPNTGDYILVFNNKYFDSYCEKCGNKRTRDYSWCEPCQINYLKNNFINWTSGNKKIDEFIQKMQLKINITREGETFEWIPYNGFININEMRGDISTAIWEDGPLYYSNIKGKYKRKLNKKVLLKYLYNSENINDTLLSKVAASIMESYGISQNPNTKEFILVLRPKNYCEICGKKYNNIFEISNKSCMSCQTNHENKIINDLIQEMRLDLDHSTIFEWIPYDQFDDIREICKGGFSTVYSAIWKDGLSYKKFEWTYIWERKPNTKVALKCLHGSQNLINEFIDKVKTYPNQKVNNIIKLYGISQDPDTKDYVIVLEYAEGGNFNNYLDKNYERFDWFNGLKMLTNVIGGLSNIHQKQMVHCYFHMGNILFTNNDNNYNACISDMGLYRKIDDINETNIYGVIPFVAPEVLKEKSYTREADIFSFGMIMYVVATGRRPFDNCAHDEVLVLNIYNGIRPEINNQIAPKCYIDLMKKCWDGNPDNRPNSIEIKEMIELFYNSLDQDFKKKEHQHYEIEEQFKETQESRKESLLSIKNDKSTTHAQAIYTSRLLNPFTKNISSSGTIEITDF
ncbi:unnamed protein product [Rhizophagus irregularis]|nr:unnamed protein product [Rhizophagus irregularis]